jgi:hypothetical protein
MFDVFRSQRKSVKYLLARRGRGMGPRRVLTQRATAAWRVTQRALKHSRVAGQLACTQRRSDSGTSELARRELISST